MAGRPCGPSPPLHRAWLSLGGHGKGTARKRDGVSTFEEDTDAEEGEEEEVQPGEMGTGDVTTLDAQVPLSADTRRATQGRGHWVHGGRAGEEGTRAQGNLNEDAAGIY